MIQPIREIFKELGIKTLNAERSDICHYNLVQSWEKANNLIQCKQIPILKISPPARVYMGLAQGFFYIRFSTIILQNKENGGISR